MSMSHITIENMGMPLVGVATGDHMDARGLCITDPTVHSPQYSGELVPFSHSGSTWESQSCTLSGQYERS